jgi:hypothetical protein
MVVCKDYQVSYLSQLPILPYIDDVAHGDQERDSLAATPVGLGANVINSKVSGECAHRAS